MPLHTRILAVGVSALLLVWTASVGGSGAETGSINTSAWAMQSGAFGPKCRVRTDPILVGAVSFLLPGVGQFLNGEDRKGFLYLSVGLALPVTLQVGAILLSAVSPFAATVLAVAAPLVYLGWAVYSALDAYNVHAAACAPPARVPY